MANDFGVSFIPGQQGQDNGQGQGGPGGPQVSPTQQAIRLLSLRLPQFSGPNGFAPSSLLSGPGAGGNPAFGPNAPIGGFPGAMPSPGDGMGDGLSPAMREALRRLAEGMRTPGMPPGLPFGGGMPGPRIIPSRTPLPPVVGDQPPEQVPVPPGAPSIALEPGQPGAGNRGGGGPAWSTFERDRSNRSWA